MSSAIMVDWSDGGDSSFNFYIGYENFQSKAFSLTCLSSTIAAEEDMMQSDDKASLWCLAKID